MATLRDFRQEDYANLLAAKVAETATGGKSAAGMKPDTTNRTIFIGLGGTGVQTISYIKSALDKRMDASWKSYVGFLAVDTSWTELAQASFLTPEQKVCITRKNGITRRWSDPDRFPGSARFMPAGTTLSLDLDGANRKRLIGKVKLHDKEPAESLGVDEEIVDKLGRMRATLAPLPESSNGKYQIYVIGSVSGGTCSGGVTEMPSLVRKAFPGEESTQVDAILYLPDTLSLLDPKFAAELKANGYATLKEFDYYMGMYMRRDYPEIWGYNGAAEEFKLKYTGDKFYNLPYLIGTPNPSKDSIRIARETIAEFLLSTLAEVTVSGDETPFLTSAFLSNAKNHSANKRSQAGGEAPDTFHEFAKRYATIGFAEASAPKKLVRAYTASQICERAGICSVTPEVKAAKVAAAAAGGAVLVPFSGKDDLLGAKIGTQKAEELLEPVKDLLEKIHNASFSFMQVMNLQEVSWKQIKEGYFDAQIPQSQVNNQVTAMTAMAVMDALKQEIQKKFADFRNKVQDYVREEGPLAFANLYEGKFIPDNGYYGVGIRVMLNNLLAGKHLNGTNFTWLNVEDAVKAFEAVKLAIANTKPPLWGIADVELGAQQTQKSQWIAAYNNLCKARINAARRETALGSNGLFVKNFIEPTSLLAQELETFGYILENLGGIYKNFGDKMESYDKFRTAQDGTTQVNLAAGAETHWQWLKNQADASLETVNAKLLREKLVDSFFGMGADGIPNSQKWLEVPDGCYKTVEGTSDVALVVDDMPIPARELFDECIAQVEVEEVDVSIQSLFEMMAGGASTYAQVATKVINDLKNRSQLLLNSKVSASHSYIMYPASLANGTGDGPAIAEALDKAAGELGIQIYKSANARSIMFYQLAVPFEIYQLNNLVEWEKEYESGSAGISAPEYRKLIHGLSPDIEETPRPGYTTLYSEGMAWVDYPPLVPKANFRAPDPQTGIVSREGQFLLKMDELIREARELGVLFCDQEDGGWVVKRICCDKATAWQFSLDSLEEMDDGMLPLGKPLAEAIAFQNGKKMDQAPFCRKVQLYEGGVMAVPAINEEFAWMYAAKVLRKHVPMYLEVIETVEKFRAWATEIRAINLQRMERKLPAMMIHILRGGLITHEEGVWSFVLPNGDEKIFCRTSEEFMISYSGNEQYMIENCLVYFLFNKLRKAMLPTVEDFKQACDRAKKNRDEMMNAGDMDGLAACNALAAMLPDQVKWLQEKGARGTEKEIGKLAPSKAFVAAMEPLTAEQVKDIELFYARTNKWENF